MIRHIYNKISKLLAVIVTLLLFQALILPSVASAAVDVPDKGNVVFKFTDSTYNKIGMYMGTPGNSTTWGTGGGSHDTASTTYDYLGEGEYLNWFNNIVGKGYRLYSVGAKKNVPDYIRIPNDQFKTKFGTVQNMSAEWIFRDGIDEKIAMTILPPPNVSGNIIGYWKYNKDTVSPTNRPQIDVEHYGTFSAVDDKTFEVSNKYRINLSSSPGPKWVPPFAGASCGDGYAGTLAVKMGSDWVTGRPIQVLERASGSATASHNGSVWVSMGGKSLQIDITKYGSSTTKKDIPITITSLDKNNPLTKEVMMSETGTFKVDGLKNGVKYKASVDHKLDTGLMDVLDAMFGDEKFTTTVLKGETEFTASAECETQKEIKIVCDFEQESIVSDLFADTLKDVFTTIIGGLTWMIDTVSGWLAGILKEGEDLSNPALEDVWRDVRNLSLSLLTLGILVIAFANVLNIKQDQYNLPIMLKRLVMGIVMTYFSFLIAQFLLNFATAIEFTLLRNNAVDVNTFPVIAELKSTDPAAVADNTGQAILVILILIAMIVAIVWLCILLIVRIVVIYFLVSLSPLAFMLSIMPFSEKLYMQWWQRFWNWMLMGPAVTFMLWMAGKFLSVGVGTSYSGFDLGDPSTWIFALMAIVALILAGSIPLIMGKDIYAAIQKHGTKVPGVKGAQAFLKARQKTAEERRNRHVQSLRAGLTGYTPKNRLGRALTAVPNFIGRRMAGYTKDEAVASKGQAQKAAAKVFEGARAEDLNNFIGQTAINPAMRNAQKRAMEAAAEAEQLDMDNGRVAAKVEAHATENNDFKVKVDMKMPDAWSRAFNAGHRTERTMQYMMQSLRKRPVDKFKGADLTAMRDLIRQGGAHGADASRLAHEIASSAAEMKKIRDQGRQTQAQWGEVFAAAGARPAPAPTPTP